MTPEQRELARHALGLPNRNRKSYRNHFVTGPGSSDFDNWITMVEAGEATRRAGNALTGGDDLFHLTLTGANAALAPREKLDLEDFPKATRAQAAPVTTGHGAEGRPIVIQLRPVTRDVAHAFIREHHRHHGAPVGEIWRHAVHDDDGVLVGVACVGRPVARELDDGWTVEITRMCTLNAPNADSMMYAAARKTAEAKGYRRGLTYLLASEWDRFDGNRRIGGAGVRAAGFAELWRVAGRSWNCESRPRADKHPTEDKVACGWGPWPVRSKS